MDSTIHLWIQLSIYGFGYPFMDSTIHLWIQLSIYGADYPFMDSTTNFDADVDVEQLQKSFDGSYQRLQESVGKYAFGQSTEIPDVLEYANNRHDQIFLLIGVL